MTTIKSILYTSDVLTRRWNETRLHHIDPLRGVLREDKYRWLAEVDLGPGVILDVGANYGQSAIAIRHHRPDRDVLCIEANPDLQPSLKKLARRDPGVQYVMVAAAAEAGFVSLTVPKFHGSQNTGGATLDQSFLERRSGELESRYGAAMDTVTHVVPAMPLAALPVEVAAVKIDVEGLEEATLQGLGSKLEHRPPVFIEIRHSDGAAMRLLRNLGYELYEVGANGLPVGRIEPEEALERSIQDVLALATSAEAPISAGEASSDDA